MTCKKFHQAHVECENSELPARRSASFTASSGGSGDITSKAEETVNCCLRALAGPPSPTPSASIPTCHHFSKFQSALEWFIPSFHPYSSTSIFGGDARAWMLLGLRRLDAWASTAVDEIELLECVQSWSAISRLTSWANRGPATEVCKNTLRFFRRTHTTLLNRCPSLAAGEWVACILPSLRWTV